MYFLADDLSAETSDVPSTSATLTPGEQKCLERDQLRSDGGVRRKFVPIRPKPVTPPFLPLQAPPMPPMSRFVLPSVPRQMGTFERAQPLPTFVPFQMPPIARPQFPTPQMQEFRPQFSSPQVQIRSPMPSFLEQLYLRSEINGPAIDIRTLFLGSSQCKSNWRDISNESISREFYAIMNGARTPGKYDLGLDWSSPMNSLMRELACEIHRQCDSAALMAFNIFFDFEEFPNRRHLPIDSFDLICRVSNSFVE